MNVNPLSVKGGGHLVIRCTYFVLTAKQLNIWPNPWGSVTKIHLRNFPEHSELSMMTSSVTSSRPKYGPKSIKNAPPLKTHEGYVVKSVLIVG